MKISLRQLTMLTIGLFFTIHWTGIQSTLAQNPRSASIPQSDELSAERVKEAIRRGTNFLRRNSKTHNSNRGGLQGLKALAFLNSGFPPNDPDVATLISEIRGFEANELTTYSSSLRIMVLAAADPEGKLYTREIRKDVDKLVGSQVTEGLFIGGWHYHSLNRGMNTGIADPSNSQFAILALHEAAMVGVEVHQKVWERAEQYWSALVRQDQGFAYRKTHNSTGSMTCAGISSWVIITENLLAQNGLIENGKVVCCGPERVMPIVDGASRWLGTNFSVRANPHGGGFLGRGFGDTQTHLYYMYALERAGRLSGQRFFGAHDWYREGSKHLLSLQQRNGSFKGLGGNFGEAVPEIATCFSLLFLSKGKRPVVFGKYEHSSGLDWNRHPKGIHQLTRNLEKSWSRKLNWQTVKAKGASVNDLLEARVLVISGRDDLALSDGQKSTLKKYIEGGGFVLAEACQGDGCGNNVVFERKFKALMKELFPDSQLEALPPDHPIWTAENRLLPNPEFPLLGLQACCRTSVVYCRKTLTARWQVDKPGLRQQLNRTSKEQVDWCTKLGINIAAYATGRLLRDKLDTPQLDLGDSVLTLNERVLVLPKLLHQGGADEAPNAWRNILIEAQRTGLRIKLEKKQIPIELDQLIDHPFVFMHGRDSFTLSDDEREAIRTYVERGGFLLVDSICASKPFTDAFRREMKIIFKENALEPIPADHPLWTNEKFGYALKTVTLRTPDSNATGGFRQVKIAPEMEGLTINGQIQVIFSPHDLSCAMENTAASQCEGYLRDDAALMAVKILLYVLRRGVDE